MKPMEHESLIPVIENEEPQPKPKKSEKKSGNRLGYNYIIIKSLKQSQKNDVIKCFYMKSPLDFGFCVIKEGSYNDLKDKNNRDIIDRLKWQQFLHETLQERIRIPRFIGSFEENGNYYLAIEYIRGMSFGSILRKYNERLRPALLRRDNLGKKVLNYLVQIIQILNNLHSYGIVHRDASSANFVVNRFGKVTLIDFELSYSIPLQSPNPPFQLGTNGYMSPEQMDVKSPTIKEDTFAVGAIILQTFTGLHPAKLVEASPEDLTEKIDFLIPESTISGIVKRCLTSIPAERPELLEVMQVMKLYASTKRTTEAERTDRTKYLSADIQKETIQNAINTLGSTLLADPEKGWFSEDTNRKDTSEKNKICKAWYASVHVGAAGIISFLEKAHKSGVDISGIREPLNLGLRLIYARYISTNKKQPGLLFGSDGIACTLSKSLESGLLEPNPQYDGWIEQLLSHTCTSHDLLTGLSGQILGHLSIPKDKHDDAYRKRIGALVTNLIQAQTPDGYWQQGKQLSTSTEAKIGFSTGTAGITYALLEYSNLFKDSVSYEAAERSIAWIISKSVRGAGKVTWRSRKGKELPPTLSEGIPGICLPLMSAYKSSGNKIYRKYAEQALGDLPDEIFYNNLGQWNGLSGLGETYLEAYNTFSDDRWLDRANWIAQLILRMKSVHQKHGIYWIVESEKQPVPGLMHGNTGVLNFLLRLYTKGAVPASWM